METICLLLAYKIKYPENFFILRGNHECASINRIYGFYDECKRRYNIKLWKTFTDCFNSLPVAAVIDDKIFCMHGGLSPELSDLEQITKVKRPTDIPDTGECAGARPRGEARRGVLRGSELVAPVATAAGCGGGVCVWVWRRRTSVALNRVTAGRVTGGARVG